MRILFIRHGDPDYVNDTLTQRGEKEAAALAEIISGYNISKAYISPLGRAARTAEVCLERLSMTGTTYDWLREFPPVIDHPEEKNTIVWDWLPDEWTKEPAYFDLDKWDETNTMQKGKVKEEYDKVIEGFDKIIESHGYRRDKMYYKAEKSNHDTIAFFCHFGVECVLLSRLINVSPMILWHGFCAAPTAITSVYTEERREGIASFRVNEFGATPHLFVKDIIPSKRARFVECFGDTEPDFEHK
ncbi:MAG: histidine phosphatase family protein [Butyrivibrio sp.]|nr:histidine phosphatase family protein [Butyrivibrio sp.]